MNNNVNIDVSDTLSCATLRIADASQYIEGFPVENCILEITPPATTCPVIFSVTKGFNMIFNVTNLQLMAPTTSQAVALPDGLYKIKYSINPNGTLFKEVNWFRTCALNTEYKKKVQELFTKKCDLKGCEFEHGKNSLLDIDFQIKASKYFAEDKGDLKQASDLYNSAIINLKDVNSCATC